jgi:type II secretory ATPase GspE/PulE/Tfp pilus assembly ATPase PilB-like protein
LNIPYVRLNEGSIDKAAIELIPAALARKFDLIPIYRTADEIIIALADPMDKAAIAAVESAAGCRVSVAMPIIRELHEMQDIFYGPVEIENIFGFSSSLFPAKNLLEINKDLSGVTFLNFMLLHITRSNLHSLSLQPLGDFVAVIGKQGEFSREIGRLALDYYPDLLLQIKKLGRLKGPTDICAEGTLEFQNNGEMIYFQVYTLKGKGGDYVTLKMRPNLRFPDNVEDLGMSADNLQRFRELVAVRKGIVLFSSANRDECCRIIDLFLDESDTSEKTVMILGDGPGRGKKLFPSVSLRKLLPIEMESVATALLDHEPDIVVIEDVSEGLSFKTAATAAMRGRLAVCGFSRGDAKSTLEYLLYAWHGYPVFTHIKGIVSVKGVRLLCPSCKQNYVPAVVDGPVVIGGISSTSLFAPLGCPECDNTGYQGTRYLVDVIPINDEMLALFAAAREGGEILKLLCDNGYHGIIDEEIELLAAGKISPDDYLPRQNGNGVI